MPYFILNHRTGVKIICSSREVELCRQGSHPEEKGIDKKKYWRSTTCVYDECIVRA